MRAARRVVRVGFTVSDGNKGGGFEGAGDVPGHGRLVGVVVPEERFGFFSIFGDFDSELLRAPELRVVACGHLRLPRRGSLCPRVVLHVLLQAVEFLALLVVLLLLLCELRQELLSF